jgi:hypothetical protein
MDVEELARALHESGREAVIANRTVIQIGVSPRPFFEWSDISDEAREGRRMMARFLLDRYDIEKKGA